MIPETELKPLSWRRHYGMVWRHFLWLLRQPRTRSWFIVNAGVVIGRLDEDQLPELADDLNKQDLRLGRRIYGEPDGDLIHTAIVRLEQAP